MLGSQSLSKKYYYLIHEGTCILLFKIKPRTFSERLLKIQRTVAPAVETDCVSFKLPDFTNEAKH